MIKYGHLLPASRAGLPPPRSATTRSRGLEMCNINLTTTETEKAMFAARTFFNLLSGQPILNSSFPLRRTALGGLSRGRPAFGHLRALAEEEFFHLLHQQLLRLRVG